METQKLKAREIAAYRERLVKEQGNLCPLCYTRLELEDAVLDHCHTTGHIRFALHRSCNHAEGNVRGWAKRTRSKSKRGFVERVIKHWEGDFSQNPIHPSFKTVDDKRAKLLRKRIKTLKAPHAIAKAKAELKLISGKG